MVLAGPRALVAALGAARPGLLALAAALYLAHVAVKVARWRRIVTLAQLPAPGGREALRAYGLGMLLGAVTPGRVGVHVKALAVHRGGASWDQALATTVIDQLLDVLVMAALLAPAAALLGRRLSGSAGFGLLSLLLAALALALLARQLRGRFAQVAARAYRLGRRSLRLPLLLTFLTTGMYLTTVTLLGAALGVAAAPLTLALAWVASGVVEAAPVTVAGLGTREAALLAVLAPLGVQPATLLALTLLVRAQQLLAGLLAYAAGRGSGRLSPGARPSS